MFLCAQARPRVLSDRTWWDRKIGIWPVGCYRKTVNPSKNRPAGATLFEPELIDMDKYRSMLQSLVIPAMLTEFPQSDTTNATRQSFNKMARQATSSQETMNGCSTLLTWD